MVSRTETNLALAENQTPAVVPVAVPTKLSRPLVVMILLLPVNKDEPRGPYIVATISINMSLEYKYAYSNNHNNNSRSELSLWPCTAQ
jgi:hypothetical protein